MNLPICLRKDAIVSSLKVPLAVNNKFIAYISVFEIALVRLSETSDYLHGQVNNPSALSVGQVKIYSQIAQCRLPIKRLWSWYKSGPDEWLKALPSLEKQLFHLDNFIWHKVINDWNRQIAGLGLRLWCRLRIHNIACRMIVTLNPPTVQKQVSTSYNID